MSVMDEDAPKQKVSLEKILLINASSFQQVTSKIGLIILQYEALLKKKDIPGDELNILLYIRELDKNSGLDINNLPNWQEFGHDIRLELETLMEYDLYPGCEYIGRLAIKVEKFYRYLDYRTQILNLYKEKFKPFCEEVNRKSTEAS